MRLRRVLTGLLLAVCFVLVSGIEGAASHPPEQIPSFCQAIQQGATAKGMTLAQFYAFLQQSFAAAPAAAQAQIQQTLAMTAQCLGQNSAATATPRAAQPTLPSASLSPACQGFIRVAQQQGMSLDQYAQEITRLSANAPADSQSGAAQTLAIVEQCENAQSISVNATPMSLLSATLGHATSTPLASATATESDDEQQQIITIMQMDMWPACTEAADSLASYGIVTVGDAGTLHVTLGENDSGMEAEITITVDSLIATCANKLQNYHPAIQALMGQITSLEQSEQAAMQARNGQPTPTIAPNLKLPPGVTCQEFENYWAILLASTQDQTQVDVDSGAGTEISPTLNTPSGFNYTYTVSTEDSSGDTQFMQSLPNACKALGLP